MEPIHDRVECPFCGRWIRVRPSMNDRRRMARHFPNGEVIQEACRGSGLTRLQAERIRAARIKLGKDV